MRSQEHKPRQDKAKPDTTKQDKPIHKGWQGRQAKTRQVHTTQDKTRQSKTRQGHFFDTTTFLLILLDNNTHPSLFSSPPIQYYSFRYTIQSSRIGRILFNC
jgi:hypothetical protein